MFYLTTKINGGIKPELTLKYKFSTNQTGSDFRILVILNTCISPSPVKALLVMKQPLLLNCMATGLGQLHQYTKTG